MSELGPFLHTFTSGFSAADDFNNGQPTPSDHSGTFAHRIVFSYAPPDMVRQAKLEAMEMKVRRKMLERKASLLDPHALSDLNVVAAAAAAAAAAATVRVSARNKADAVGSRDLVKSLVVPPQVTEHGEEVRGSSEFIQDGERLEYQRPGRVAPSAGHAARPMPHYRMYEASSRRVSATATTQRKKPWGVVEATGAARLKGDGGRGGGRGGGGAGGGAGDTSWSGGGDKAGRQELKAQLSDGMLSYVPSKFERPKNVERTAFVPQGQAMEEARHNYESVKQRRPASAPPRRAASNAATGKGAVGDDGGRDRDRTAVGSGGVGPVGSDAALVGAAAAGTNRAAADGGSGPLAGTPSFRGRRYEDGVPVVPVEETDLLAMYRQRSQHLLQPQQSQQPATGRREGASRSSPEKIRGTITGPRVSAATAAAAAPAASASARPAGQGVSRSAAAAGPGASATGRGAAGTMSMPNSRKSITGAAGAWDGPGQGDVAARAWARPASAAQAGAAAPGARKAARSPPRPASGAAAKAPVAPATAAEAAALASWSTRRPWSSRPNSYKVIPSVWDAPPPPSTGAKTLASSRPPSQRRISAPAGDGVGPAAANGAAAAALGGGGDVDCAGAGQRVGLQPMDPETRRQRLNRPGSAVATAKTNRLRAPPRSGNGAPPAAAWTTSSATSSPSCDRTQLQERILGSLVRQYTLGEEDEAEDDGGAAAANDTAGQVVYPPRRPVRPRATADAAGGGGSGLLAAQRSVVVAGGGHAAAAQAGAAQQSRAGRPQSAPNRRVRPPSPGHWAGRPDPDTLLSRATALQHSTTGILYDPQLNPSPLDTYMNQLNGLD